MGTISSAFHLITGALDADQAALSVVANNVANANTAGYTAETPVWQENTPVRIGGQMWGTGVTLTGAASSRDRVLNQRLDQQQQLAAASSARLSALNSIQALFSPASGSSSSTAGDIGSDLTAFFSAFASLEGNPTDSALRERVLSTATTLAGDISNVADNLGSQRASLDQSAVSLASQVNALTASIAQLNARIESTSPDGDAGVLEDQRQQQLSKLSQLIGINLIPSENNGLSVTTTSGATLVSEGTSTLITTGMAQGVTHFFAGTTNITAQLASGGGSIGGYITARDQDLPSVLNALDQLAYNLASAVNAQNNAGSDLNGTTGTASSPLNLFAPPSGLAGSAHAMSVVMTDPAQIAAAGSGAGTGDNANAVLLARLGNQLIVNGATPTDYLSSLVTNLGSRVAGVETENTAQNASVTQLQNQVNALSSVNLNDQAAALQQLERSYQAASQVFNILNSIMTSALNLGMETAVS